MNTIKIPIFKGIIEELKGTTKGKYQITEDDELELEYEECEFWDRIAKLDKELDEGKGIKMDMDKLAKELQL